MRGLGSSLVQFPAAASSRPWRRALGLARWLSLDVVAGALAGSRLAARASGAPLPTARHQAALGAAVFVIYSLDHLSDVSSLPHPPRTPRHRFYWRHFHPAAALTAAVATGGALAAWRLPPATQRFGVALGGLSGAYLALARLSGRTRTLGSLVRNAEPTTAPATQRLPWFHKEVYVAVLYAAGVWGSVWATHPPRQVAPVLGGMAFAGVALANLMLFSWFELDHDVRLGQRSLARTLGRAGLRRWFGRTVGGTALLLAAGGLTARERPVRRALALESFMLGGLTLIFVRSYFGRRERYRAWGDAVFWLGFGA